MISFSSTRTVLALGSLICLGLVGCGSSQTSSATASSATSSSKASSTATAASVVASPTGSSKPTVTPTPGHVTTVTPSPTPTAKGTVVVIDPETSTATPTQAEQVSQSTQAIQGSSSAATSATSSSTTKTQTSSSAAAQQATPACNYNSIRIAAQAVNGAAGSSYITLTFTNAGSTPCSLTGWPEVSYVDASGQTIGATATHAAEWTSSGSVLPAGGSAQATLRETRASLYGTNCQAVTAAGYRVGIPGTDKSLVLNFPAEACSNKAVAQLSVGQVGATP